MNSAGFSAYQLNCNLWFFTAQLFCHAAGSKGAGVHFRGRCLCIFVPANGYETKFWSCYASAESFIIDLTAHNKRARVFTTWILLHHSPGTMIIKRLPRIKSNFL